MTHRHQSTAAFSRWLLLVLTAAALAACSAEEPTGSEAGSTDTPQAEAANAGGTQKKIVRLPRSSEHKTLDPQRQFDQASAEIITNLYDTLLDYHFLKRPYQLVPSLLERMPELQEDGVTYLFTLKKGVHFSDDPAFEGGKGRELVTDDVFYSIKRFADANVNVLSYILIQGSIVGLDDFRVKSRDAGKGFDYDSIPVAGLTKLGSHQFSLRFTGPNPLALYPLAASSMSIVPREVVEAHDGELTNHPVGTGPFVISKLDRRGTIVLSKNPNYHRSYPSEGDPGDREAGFLADAGKQLPLIDEVHLPLIEEAQPRMLRFRKGELDLVSLDKDNFIKMATRDPDGSFHLKPPFDEQFRFYVEPRLSCEYIGFNMNDPLVGTNAALRQAIAYALDVDAFIELMLNGRAEKLATIVPHPIAGSERDIDIEYFHHDPEMAKKKLAEAGYPEGKGLPPIVFDYRNASRITRQSFEFVRNELAAVGITAQARFHTFSAYLQRIESGNFQVGLSGWAADYPDAENFYQLLYGKNVTPGPNMSSFVHEEYDRLYEESRFMENGPERFAKFQRMAEIIRDETPVILRYNGLAFGLVQHRLKNMKRNIMIDAPYKFLNVAEN